MPGEWAIGRNAERRDMRCVSKCLAVGWAGDDCVDMCACEGRAAQTGEGVKVNVEPWESGAGAAIA
jgi:hypothetical protein